MYPKITKNIRRLFPGAEIVLATYIGMNTAGLDYDKVALVEDPGFYLYDNTENPKENNVNRQIATTVAGLRAATRLYAFKLRSDFVLTGRGFLDYFNQFLKTDTEYRVFEKKILSCVFFSRDPRRDNSFPFHPSDIAFFGLRADLLNLFDIPLMPKEEAAYYQFKKIKYVRYLPEQYLWINCLRKNGKDIKCDHQRDCDDRIAEDTERYLVSNFINLDWVQFDLSVPKRLTLFSKNNFQDVITHIEWQRLYKRYLDNVLIVPERNCMREFIERNTAILKRYKLLAKLCAMPLGFGKILGTFRRKTRKRIFEFLTRKICLPSS
jgi:hypothetical protein